MSNVLQNTGGLTLKDRGAPPWGSKALIPPYAIGVPHPASFFGYDPLTEAEPDDPAEWPEAQNTSYYYIDNSDGAATDTANTYGYPDKPRLTVPEGDFTGTVKMVIGGGGSTYTITGDGRWEMTFVGIPEAPVFMVGRGASLPVFDKEIRFVSCENLIVDGLRCERHGVCFNVHGGSYWEFVTIRNCEMEGDLTPSSGAVINVNGGTQQSTPPNHLVVYNNDIRDFGENLATSTENDIHGIKPEQNVESIWYIGNTVTNLGGDCIQVGSATTPSADRVRYIYVAKNDLSDTLENAIDTKRCLDVIVSENEIYGWHREGTGGGLNVISPIIVHNGSEWTTFIANKIHDNGGGIVNTEGPNFNCIANEIYNVTPVVSPYDPTATSGEGKCIHVRAGTSNGFIANNTLYNYAGAGIQVGSNIDVQITANIFSGRSLTDGYEILYSNTSDYVAGDTNYNLFYGPTFTPSFRRGSTVETLAQYQVSTGNEANAQTGDPAFTNAGTGDFTLGGSSDAIDNGIEDAFYDAFFTRYGIDIKVDIANLPRPATSADWDIGANED